MKQVYQANDGKVFETKDEWISNENNEAPTGPDLVWNTKLELIFRDGSKRINVARNLRNCWKSTEKPLV